jgi:hypothetical protein
MTDTKTILADMIADADDTATSSGADSFARFGDDRVPGAYAAVCHIHRESEALDLSNWQVIGDDLRARFGEDSVHVESFSHCMVGWTEVMLVRVGTPECAAAVEWRVRLDIYPVADEDHFLELERQLDHPDHDGVCYSEYCRGEGECALGRELA